MPAMSGDDAVDKGKPHARSLIRLLGGEERVEDVLAYLRGDTVPCVAYP